jgi:hypothetical protein
VAEQKSEPADGSGIFNAKTNQRRKCSASLLKPADSIHQGGPEIDLLEVFGPGKC